MKTLFKLISLVCLSCGALNAESYLVALQAPNGQYVCAEDGGGGGGDLNANRWGLGPWETFIMENINGGPITFNSHVSIRSVSKNMYWCAERPSKGYDIECNRPVRGPWEDFLIYVMGQFETGTKIYLITYMNHTAWCRHGGGDQVGGYWPGDLGYSQFGYPDFTLTVLAVLP